MSAPARIEACGIGKRFGRRRALVGVDLRVAAGESVAVLGPNGAGKSTLLRIVAGLARPDEGRVLLDGHPISAEPERARRRTGYLGHQTMLYDSLGPRENLTFTGRLFGVASVRTRVDQLLRALDLTDRASSPVHELSRGTQQRVALARALIHEPDVLLLDEPHAGLDARACDVLGRLLEALSRRGRSLLLVTHDARRALELCSRVVVLDRGRIVADLPSAGLDAREIEASWVQRDVSGAGAPRAVAAT